MNINFTYFQVHDKTSSILCLLLASGMYFKEKKLLQKPPSSISWLHSVNCLQTLILEDAKRLKIDNISFLKEYMKVNKRNQIHLRYLKMKTKSENSQGILHKLSETFLSISGSVHKGLQVFI